ncbi:MAG: type I secretion system permease/ATPase [Rubrivivax sp.]|nr:type I secretion system permease/ATPase [Rubrivivax sp.]
MKPRVNGRVGALARALGSLRRELVCVGVFSFFANLLLLAPTLYMLQVFDRVLLSGSTLTLLALTGFTVFLVSWMALAEWLRSRLLVRVGLRIDQRLNGSVFDAAFASQLARPDPRSQQAFTDLTQLRQFLTGTGAFAAFDSPWTPVYIAVLFLMHPLLGWTATVFALLMAGLAVWSHRVTSPRQEAALDAGTASTAYLGAKLRNAETVEALGMVGNLRRRWLALHGRQLARSVEAHDASARMQAATKFVQYTQQSLMLAVAALLVIDGQLGLGAMVAANALMSNALRPMSTLVATWNQLIEARKAYRRLDALIAEHEQRGDVRAIQVAPLEGQVTLRGLTATAPRRQEPILKSVEAQFVAGEVVTIVGPSGAGKSTLARCLLGIWPDVSGEVLLDGRDVRDWPRDVLGHQVGYLPQDIELFDGTIAENIARFGEVAPKQVVEAATRSGIHEMILRFPKGYDTPMGEAGSLLSGGQRQRIGLARALYGSPKLVVLDEPNANLDDAGEAALVRAVRDLRDRGTTVFMITHQRNLLTASDRVLVMKDGEIVQLAHVPAPLVASPAAVPGVAV